MKALVACEYSGRVRDALTKKGIDAISCDLLLGMINTCYRQPDQIHPYYFRGEKKQTCLWLKNLPPLFHSKHDTLFEKRTHGELGEDFIMNSSHRQTKWYNNNKNERSTLFPSIAEAMADQWAKHLKIKI